MKKNENERLIWLNGEIKKIGDAKINVLSPTSQFGLNVFEGIRCYWNDEEKQLYAFRLKEHYMRLKKSQKLLKFENKYSISELEKAFIDIIVSNNYREDIAVRQTLFIQGFGSWSSKEELGMFIAPISKNLSNKEYNKKGLNCCVSTWRRISDNSLSPRIKCGANYINSRMAQLEAIERGYETAILLNEHGTVSEGPGSCLFIIKEDKKIVTPEISNSILESITRDSIIQICRNEFNLEVEERSISRTELYTCEEAFLCGSAMEINPINSVDGYKINGEELTKKISEAYMKIVRGKNKNYKKWLTKIY